MKKKLDTIVTFLNSFDTFEGTFQRVEQKVDKTEIKRRVRKKSTRLPQWFTPRAVLQIFSYCPSTFDNEDTVVGIESQTNASRLYWCPMNAWIGEKKLRRWKE